MAKAAAKKTPAKKTAKADASTVRPIKETMTKSALINLIAEQNELPRKTAVAVYATIEKMSHGTGMAEQMRAAIASGSA